MSGLFYFRMKTKGMLTSVAIDAMATGRELNPEIDYLKCPEKDMLPRIWNV